MSDKFESLMDSEPSAATPGVVEQLTGGGEDGQEKGEEGGQEGLLDAEPEVPKEGAEAEAGAEPTKEEAPPPPPGIKAKAGESELEVPEDASFTVRVNSKDESVTLKELIRNYQGRVPWEQHYRQLKESDRRFQADKKLVDDKISDLVNTLEKDPKGALEKLILWAGKNPADFATLYADEMQELDEAGQKVFLQKKRLEHDTKSLEANKAKLDREAAERQLESYVISKQKEHNITDEELNTAFTTMDSLIKEGRLKVEGMDPKAISDLAINFILTAERPYQKMVGLIKQTAQEVKPTPEDIKFLNNIIDPSMSEKDVVDIIRSFYQIGDSNGDSSDAAPDAAEDLSKERPTRPTSPKIPQKVEKKAKPKAEVEEDDDDPVTFDDLLRPYQR